jgi:hypothetical protein
MEASNIRSQWEFNQILSGGEGKAKGIDVYLSQQWNNYTASAAYSIANVNQRFDELNRGREFDADHDQLHELKLMQFVKAGRFLFSMDWLYGSGNPYSQPSEAQTLNGKTRIIYTERNNARLPQYHRMDVSVSYPFKAGKASGDIGASIFNLYDRNNVGNRSYVFDRQDIYNKNQSRQGQSQLYSYDQYLLGRSLSIFMNISF